MSYENPASFLVDVNGTELAVSQSQVLTGSGIQPGFLMAGSGSDGVVRMFKVAPGGELFVTGTINASVAQTPNLPVSQGNPGGLSSAWPVKITDGTQVLGGAANTPIWTSGSVSVNNFPAVQSVTGSVQTIPSGIQVITGSVTVNDIRGTQNNPMWVSGAVYATQESNPTATATVVPAAVTVTTLLASNNQRRAAIIFNDSSKRLFVKLGAGASASSYTIKMSAQGYWEVPGFYTGIITGIWEQANGQAAVTEIID